MDPSMYERALERTGQVVAGTKRDQLDDGTPCPDWDVRALLNHIIGGCAAFAAGARGEKMQIDDGTDHTASDHVAAYDQAAKDALAGFQAPGAMDQEFTMGWGDTPAPAALGLAIADAVVHGWDLARATGQDYAIDDDAAEAIYGMTSGMMEPKGSYPRGESFAPPVNVPDDARPADRMLAYLGRKP